MEQTSTDKNTGVPAGLQKAVLEASRKIGGRCLFLSDNAPALIMAKLRDERKHHIIADFYSGGFHMCK
jgi:hypothetical protein|tara:strand:+ start:42 stop:245 length:204 start_codon:yes stop_codon:yes gene_type:complete